VTAREWSQQVEWAIHAPIALREGIAADTVQAIAEGRRPRQMPEDEALLYDFCIGLHRNRSISEQAVALWGEYGVMDLVAANGYYRLLSMVMNAARTEVPASTARRLPDLP